MFDVCCRCLSLALFFVISSALSAAQLGSVETPRLETCARNPDIYLTRLPQQCLRTERPRSADSASQVELTILTHQTLSSQNLSLLQSPTNSEATSTQGLITTSVAVTSAANSSAEPSNPNEPEAEPDSPLDVAHFLSFEEWKKQNLAKAGQSPEHIGQARPQASGKRQRPDLNALESLGDESEINLDFSFGSADPLQPSVSPIKTDESPSTGLTPRSKDAGKTCKERTNYASFDCAATVLKTNPECKHASSVLIENKDSYMLNTCSAPNKFFIVELCNDILIDTIVLANYEFFSSIFRHFRISVSDRYPVKLDKWKDLGTFEAKNTREVQAFLVENPLIWARYLRIEFLSHFGNEYYCPLSLLRVHGTTMMQEFRHQEELARGENPDDDPTLTAEASPAPPVEPAVSDAIKNSQSIIEPAPEDTHTPAQIKPTSSSETASVSSDEPKSPETAHVAFAAASTCPRLDNPLAYWREAVGSTASASSRSSASATSGPTKDSVTPTSTQTTFLEAKTQSSRPTSPNPPVVTTASPIRSADDINHSQRSTASTFIASAQPPTQESFFKSIHKRLQQLESNSTLSLQYIEEQSRLLRDAFTKVEKRQVASASKFLSRLNETILAELNGFRQAYDQLLRTTVVEVESQQEQYRRELLALNNRLTLVADELLWQERMGVIQSTLLLLCLGLVLFSRQAAGGVEVPFAQQIILKSQAALRTAGWDSDGSPSSPLSAFRLRRGTNPSVASGSEEHVSEDEGSEEGSVLGTQSGPATPSGSVAGLKRIDTTGVEI
ncbi:hypothetical protein K470DRAFT_256439 [Piedraia hortae CBS 480.64]|uniref:SUN domain-containing protein n=1 Tax=Piedraia hortae CBS 480.64 TaxID=1314780 RepID=A0A6A7C3R3_9PEZI|nr:hypothetical protein K470DRAFT_256439 [Piedraia hortae CBS 480.64]